MTNTYYVPIQNKNLPDEGDQKERIGYYQWVPLILLCQAVLFYFPAMVWRFLSNKAGIDIQNIVDAAMTLQHGAYMDKRSPNLDYMVRHVDRYLSTSKEHKSTCWGRCKKFTARYCFIFCGRRYGNYVTTLYLTIKTTYLANVVGQLFLLNAFLGDDYHLYGFEVLRKLVYGHDWGTSYRFPRVTLCDFYVRKLGNIQRHTVQCVLPINLFNEKIYIFVWFWFVFVAVITLINIVTWVCRSLIRKSKVNYVLHHLGSVVKNIPKEDRKFCREFVDNYLKQDGILVLRLVGTNANDLAVAEMIQKLWECYRTKRGIRRVDPSAPMMDTMATTTMTTTRAVIANGIHRREEV